MSIQIEGHNYTGFIDYDRVQLRGASLNAKIQWLQYRVRKIITDPLDQILPPGAPYHQPINRGDRTFNLCGVTLVACTIEGLGHFLIGTDEEGTSFRTWLKAYMPNWNVTTATGQSIPNWLWDSARNGLAHQLAFKSGGTEAHNGQRFIEQGDGQIEMDPFVFYSDFKAGVDRFFRDLQTKQVIRINFENRFGATLLQ